MPVLSYWAWQSEVMAMIKINLLRKEKRIKIHPALLAIRWKYLLAAIGILFSVDFIINTFLMTKLRNLQSELETKNQKLTQVNAEIATYGDLEKKMEAFKRQIETLKERERQVEELIRTKANPTKILLHVSRSIPDDIWIEGLTINGRSFELTGFSQTFKSIDEFRNRINDSIFFNKSISLTTSRPEFLDQNSEFRVESFSLTGSISRFD